MYPNQPQTPPPPPSSTYLDEIAAPATQNTMKPWMLWSLIGGVLLVAGLVLLMALNSGGPNPTQRLTNFIYRVNALQTLAKDSPENITDSKLLSNNAQMSSILAGISQEGTQQIINSGKKELPKEPKNSPVAAEYVEINTRLDEARLNVVFDRTYAREVAYQIRTLRNELLTLQKSGKSSLKEYLKTADQNLEPLEKQFASFDSAS